MTKTKKSDEISVDWNFVDSVIKSSKKELPKNAFTTKMIAEKYGLSESGASKRMRNLEKTGKFNSGTYNTGSGTAKYLISKG